MPLSSPIDDFLADTDTSTATAERLEAIGLGLSLFGSVLALGVLVFVLLVHRGPRREIVRLLQLVVAGGVLMVLGGVIESVGTARLLDAGWWDTLVDGTVPGAMLRTLGGLLVVVGIAVERPVTGDSHDAAPPSDVRWTPALAHGFALNGVAFGAVSFSFDGHTVTEGPRLAHAALDLIHVTAGGIWFGGIIALAFVALTRRAGVRPMLVRFAPVATVALVVVAIAGASMTLFIVDAPGDLTGTPWGRRYLLKVGLVGAAALLGAHHHFRVVPRLRATDDETADPEDAAAFPVRGTLAVEAVVLAAVVVTTVLLVRASTH
jgi:copper transport protein